MILLITYSIIFYFTLACYARVLHNQDLIADGFQKYIDCAHSSPGKDCIQHFRKYAAPQLMLAANFAAFNEFVIGPTILSFAYKEVTKLWYFILTCRWCARKNVGKVSQAYQTEQTVVNSYYVRKIPGDRHNDKGRDHVIDTTGI
jgi:hypothetical protein